MAQQLRRLVEQELPQYMRCAIRLESSLPLTASGKVDVPAVAAREWSDEDSSLRQIVRELLQLDEIPEGEDLFGLGLTSISAMQLVARARQRGIYLEAQDPFEVPTMLRLVRRAQARAD